MPSPIRRVATTVCVTLLVNLAVVIGIAGTVNPLGNLWGRRFPTATPITRYRKVRLFEAWSQQAPVEGLVMGSSRSMKLAPGEFASGSGFRFFNFALSEGTLEDIDAILGYVIERHAKPRLLIVGVDPPMLTPMLLPVELTQDWELAARIDGGRPTIAWKVRHGLALLAQTLTPAYGREVGTSIVAAWKRKEPLHHFHEDGYLEYPARDRAIAAGRFDRAGSIGRCVKEIVDSLESVHVFDTARIARLERTLDQARQQGIRVLLWHTPQHPSFYASVERSPVLDAFLRSIPDTLERIARSHHVPFVNLSAIASFDGDPTDYYDCMHYGAANARRISERLLAALARDSSAAPNARP